MGNPLSGIIQLGKAAGSYVTDGFENILTGLGVSGRDAGQGGRYTWRRPTYRELEIHHDSSDIAQIVCDEIPMLATKKWITHVVPEDSGGSDIVEKLIEEDERLDAKMKFFKAVSWSRIYGGAMMMLVVDDGKSQEDPLDLNSINRINNLVVLHRWEVHRQVINSDLVDPNFGMPTHYAITGRTVKDVPSIHYSRFIRFDGKPLSEEGFRANDYWHDSHLTTLRDVAREFDEAYKGVAAGLRDFGINVLRIKDLAEIVSAKNEDLLKRRLQLMQLSKSILSSIVIDANEEEFQLLERSFTNVANVLDKLDKRLQMVTRLPHTVLFGEGSTGTLGAGGESEQNTLADVIAGVQDYSLRQQLKKYSQIVQSQKQGPTGGKLLEGYSIKFNPLNEPTERQQAEYRRLIAETDHKYYEMGVLTPSEIADSRFGGEGFSTEIKIDKEAREMQKDLDKAKVESKIENPMGVKPDKDGSDKGGSKGKEKPFGKKNAPPPRD